MFTVVISTLLILSNLRKKYLVRCHTSMKRVFWSSLPSQDVQYWLQHFGNNSFWFSRVPSYMILFMYPPFLSRQVLLAWVFHETDKISNRIKFWSYMFVIFEMPILFLLPLLYQSLFVEYNTQNSVPFHFKCFQIFIRKMLQKYIALIWTLHQIMFCAFVVTNNYWKISFLWIINEFY